MLHRNFEFKQQIEMSTETITNRSLNLTVQQQVTYKFSVCYWYPLVPISMLVMVSNGVICHIYYHNRHIRVSQTNTLLFNQSCIDIVRTLLYVPTLIISSYWSIFDVICSTVYMYSFLLSLLSLFTLAMERLWCIWKPLHHRSVFSTRVMIILLLMIWIVPLPVAMLIWAFRYESNTSYAAYIWAFIALMLLIFSSTLGTYFITFYKIGKIIRGRYHCTTATYGENGIHIGGGEETRSELFVKKQLRLVQLGSALFLCYAIGYFPTLFENMMVNLRKFELLNEVVRNFVTYSYVLSALINPLLCLIMKEDYRKAFKSLLHIKNKV